MSLTPFFKAMNEEPTTAFGQMPVDVPMLPQDEEEDLTHTPEFEIPEDSFNENLAEKIKEQVLSGIAANIVTAIEQDKESRLEWEQAYIKGMKYLG